MPYTATQQPVSRFVCGSQPEIRDGSDQEQNQGARRTKRREGKKPEIDPAIIEQLMKDYQRPEDLTGAGGIMEQLTKRLYERLLGAEMTHYLGDEKGQAPKADEQRENNRNGTSKKKFRRASMKPPAVRRPRWTRSRSRSSPPRTRWRAFRTWPISCAG